MKAKKKTVAKKKVDNRPRVPVTQFTIRGRKVKKYKSISEAASQTGVNTGSISKVTRGICATAGGFRWEIGN